ncbi:hypothetical protein VP1G_07795 [Cytospora mali]|uniref:Rhodopsin domain-containing protein n=1 Tax=Cytospora mali TaxID=578113 RepID=A0A194V9D2_CYTMA|nr:hypothetical protein VP1G_07795 [Valsa mali var. pyri (nom. inval.)]
MMGEQATTYLPLMWVFVAIVFVFIGLRLYTRLHIVDQLGTDDHVYNLSGIFLLLYVVFLQISAEYGFGQDIITLSPDDAACAVMWEMIGQTFAVLGMALAKWSLGLFLLRIVVQRWHRVAIWSIMVSLLIVSLLTAVMFWVQCLPSASIFDQRVQGRCFFKITQVSILLGAWCVFADFSFAVLPWLFIWSLNMSRHEKLTIAGSMSLGVFAGACGIVRTVALEGFNKATVGLIVWSAAEMAITMVCIGIPVLRPLFTRWFPILGGSSRDRYNRYGDGRDGPVFTMHTIGGDVMKGGRRRGPGFPDAPEGSGLRGPTTRTQISALSTQDSDEAILGSAHRHGAGAGAGVGASVVGDQGCAIRVREDVMVEYDSDRGMEPSRV